MKIPNQFANRTERLTAKAQLPKAFLHYLHTQEQLTQIFRQVVSEVVSVQASEQCQVVRYHEGELIISTHNATLVNHLRYVHDLLVTHLRQQPKFAHVYKLHLVYSADTAKNITNVIQQKAD